MWRHGCNASFTRPRACFLDFSFAAKPRGRFVLVFQGIRIEDEARPRTVSAFPRAIITIRMPETYFAARAAFGIQRWKQHKRRLYKAQRVQQARTREITLTNYIRASLLWTMKGWSEHLCNNEGSASSREQREGHLPDIACRIHFYTSNSYTCDYSFSPIHPPLPPLAR